MKTLLQLYRDNAERVIPTNLAVNAAEPSIYIYDMISAEWGYGALDAVADIAAVGDVPVLNVRISSPGGDVFESRAIMNAIKRFNGKTVAHIDGLCASAATSIALACDEVVISDDSMFMVHNAQGMAFGDKSAMRATADLMETVEMAIVNDYTAKTGKSEDEIKALMQAETWMTPKQALEHGFVDRISDNKSKVANTWNLAAYQNAPAELVPPAAAADLAIDNAAVLAENAALLEQIAALKAAPTPAAEPEPIPQPSMQQANTNRLALALAL